VTQFTDKLKRRCIEGEDGWIKNARAAQMHWQLHGTAPALQMRMSEWLRDIDRLIWVTKLQPEERKTIRFFAARDAAKLCQQHSG